DALVLFDMRNGDRVGSVIALPPKANGPVLHSDGTALACNLSSETPNTVAIYSTNTGQQLSRIQVNETGGSLNLVDFVAGDQLLTYFFVKGQDPRFDLWDIKGEGRKGGFKA